MWSFYIGSVQHRVIHGVILCSNPSETAHVLWLYTVDVLCALTLSDPGYFRQLTIRGGGLKAPPPPPTILKTIVSINTISYM